MVLSGEMPDLIVFNILIPCTENATGIVHAPEKFDSWLLAVVERFGGATVMGMALRGYYTSPGHDQPFIESHLDIRDAEGEVVPGYGWIFPLGDGRVNVGVGLLSTDRRWKGVNTGTLMQHFVAGAPEEWELTPATALGPPTGGKLPMGLAVGPRLDTLWPMTAVRGGKVRFECVMGSGGLP